MEGRERFGAGGALVMSYLFLPKRGEKNPKLIRKITNTFYLSAEYPDASYTAFLHFSLLVMYDSKAKTNELES